MYAYPYGMNNNMQQQLAQNRMEQPVTMDVDVKAFI